MGKSKKKAGGASKAAPQGHERSPEAVPESGSSSNPAMDSKDNAKPGQNQGVETADDNNRASAFQRKLSLNVRSTADDTDLSGFMHDAGPIEMTPSLQQVDSIFAREVERLESEPRSDTSPGTRPALRDVRPVLSIDRTRSDPEADAPSPPPSPTLLVTPSIEEVEQAFQAELGKLGGESSDATTAGVDETKAVPPTQAGEPVQHGEGPVYKLEALLAGREWPSGIDPTKREAYLADDDFKSVFGIAKGEFYALPKWRQIARKKDVGLF